MAEELRLPEGKRRLDEEVIPIKTDTHGAVCKARRPPASTVEPKLKKIKLENAPKYRRHQQLQGVKRVSDKKLRSELRLQQRLDEEGVKRLAASEILLPSTPGYLEAEGPLERTYKFSQQDIEANLDVGSRQKLFDLRLSYGPYTMDFARNGRHLLFGGEKGHIALLDCHTMKSLFDINVRETVRAVQVLQNYTMVAAAQKKYVYIYDQNGIELHCLRDHKITYRLEYLPYHYLLCTVGEFSELTYRDISTGAVVASHKLKLGPVRVMRQNPMNAVLHLGHTNGTVTLWTPNMGKPVVKMLCHKGAVTGMDIHKNYMATAGLDGKWRIWDLRKYEPVHHFWYFGTPPSWVSFSQTGLVGLAFGPHVQVWKDATLTAKPKMPYMEHDLPGETIECVRFRPFEDVCAIGHSAGVSTLVVPGAGLPNFDSFEANPFETKKQRREKEVRDLLEKLQPDMITLDPMRIGMVDDAPKAVILEEQRKEAEEAASKKKKKPKKKMRGRSKAGKRAAKRERQYASYIREKAQERVKQQGGAAGEPPPQAAAAAADDQGEVGGWEDADMGEETARQDEASSGGGEKKVLVRPRRSALMRFLRRKVKETKTERPS
ncbi:unnamed protein product [Vitrella brassicaformis CCMP3155]|uniref:BING4 C-terminal domain-containing protein n=2 Tax=Vitrella brassicaformis TaxID=1169539 RepID=A0A0G4EVG7_VITBC|nr:unnamed protein product [Vitrella brassicaformis CCMP3155]|eukprot:CEM02401.1 unnamed protein product [Vitrella brassicaformis CCMP3155]